MFVLWDKILEKYKSSYCLIFVFALIAFHNTLLFNYSEKN